MTPCGKEALILAFEAVRQKWRERDDSRCVVGVVHLARDQLRKRFRYIGEHVTCIWINRQCVQLTMDWFFVCQHKRRSIEDQQKTLNQSSWFHWFYFKSNQFFSYNKNKIKQFGQIIWLSSNIFNKYCRFMSNICISICFLFAKIFSIFWSIFC